MSHDALLPGGRRSPPQWLGEADLRRFTRLGLGDLEQLRLGIPLTDEDRRPWLAKIRKAIGAWVERREPVVFACSLLKAAYRASVLDGYSDQVRIVYLKAGYSLLQQRLAHRTGHFMGEALLASQWEILEEPTDAVVVDAAKPAAILSGQIRSALNL